MLWLGERLRENVRVVGLALGLLAACSTPAAAQVVLGDSLNMHLKGDMGFTYGGSFGSFGSSHGTGLIGNGVLDGFYYNPKFVSFEFRPTYNRSQNTADTGFIADTKGFGASFNLFGGSVFPGSVYYSNNWSDSSQYGIAGGPGLYTANSNSKSLSVSWGLLLPNKPTLQATYTATNTAESILGSNDEVTNKHKDLILSSTYNKFGFNMMGNVGWTHQNLGSPGFLDNGSSIETSTNTTYYDFQAQHSLPLNGIFTGGINHSNNDFEGRGSSITTWNLGGGINPTSRISINSSLRYTSNTFGSFEQQFYLDGIRPALRNSESNSLIFENSATYRIFRGLDATGFIIQRQQDYIGTEISDTSYGGMIRYTNMIPFLGIFRLGFGLVDYADNDTGNHGLGNVILDGGLSRTYGKWDFSVDGTYSQALQTDFGNSTTSSFSYSGSFKKKFAPATMWFGTFRAQHSALTRIDGTNNRGETVSTGFTLGRYGATATYSQAGGTSVLSPTGILTPSPLTPLVTDDYLLFNAKSFAVSASALFRGRISLVGTYDRTWSETNSDVFRSQNEGDRYYLRLRYKVRKLWIGGTYKRVEQSITANGQPPRMVNSFSVEITRWFDVF